MYDLNAWDWLGLSLALFAFEILISGIFLFWVGIGAIIVALLLVLVPDISWQVQLLVFGVTTIGTILVWSYFGRSRFQKPAGACVNLNDRSLNYVGQSRLLSESIVGGKGALIIDDSRWIVTGPDLAIGTLVQITAVVNGELTVIESTQQQ